MDRDYFFRLPETAIRTPAFSDEELRRRHRVSRSTYERVRCGLLTWEDPFIRERPDALGVLLVFRIIAAGDSADTCVEYSRLGESTNLQCLKKFAGGVYCVFEEDWLPLPREDELEGLSEDFSALGFLGTFGSVDCTLVPGYVPSRLAG